MTRIRSSSGSMIDDRRGRGGGGGGMSFPGLGGRGGGGMGIPTKAGGGILGIIIMLAAIFLPKLLGGGGGSGQSVGQPSEDATDGMNTEIEQVVAGAAEDVQRYWEIALPQYFQQDYPSVKTVLFGPGSVETACGPATSEVGPFYCPGDSLVYIDLEFMQQLERQLVGSTADLAEQYIMAHEYGHHVQNVLGTNRRADEARQTGGADANQYSIALELQADCYAGLWVGDIAGTGGLESSNEIDEALAAAAGVGDDRIQQKTQGRIDPESWTHGSAEQRQEWFMRGFDTKDPLQCDTFTALGLS